MTVVSEVAHFCASSEIVLAATARGFSSTSCATRRSERDRDGRMARSRTATEAELWWSVVGWGASTFAAADMWESYPAQVADADQPASCTASASRGRESWKTTLPGEVTRMPSTYTPRPWYSASEAYLHRRVTAPSRAARSTDCEPHCLPDQPDQCFSSCQVLPPSDEASNVTTSAGSVSYQKSNVRRAGALPSCTGADKVTVRASPTPENQAVSPSRGRTGSASAMSRATARRAGLLLPQVRLGCTRFVSRMTNDRLARSMTIEVPVNPVCPAVSGPDSPSMYHIWSSSKPSPCAFPGNAAFSLCIRPSTEFSLRMRVPP